MYAFRRFTGRASTLVSVFLYGLVIAGSAAALPEDASRFGASLALYDETDEGAAVLCPMIGAEIVVASVSDRERLGRLFVDRVPHGPCGSVRLVLPDGGDGSEFRSPKRRERR